MDNKIDNVKSFLEKIGISSDQVEKLVRNEFSIEDAYSIVKDEQRKLLLNDTKFMENLRDEAQATFATNFNKTIRKVFELNNEDTQDKKLHELLEVGKEKVTNKIVEQYKDTNDAKLVTDLTNARRMLTEKEHEIERLRREEIPSIENKYKQQVEEYRLKSQLLRKLELMKLNTKADIAFPAVIESIYKKGWKLEEEKGDIVLKNKDGSLVTNDDNSKFITLEQHLTHFLSDANLLIQSNANDETSYKYTVSTQPKTLITNNVEQAVAAANNLVGSAKIANKLNSYNAK